MKACPKCGNTKPVAEFHKDASKRDGLHYICKPCGNAASAKWRAANKERARVSTAAWRAKNPDKCRERRDSWHLAHPNKAKEAKAKWAAANPEVFRVYRQNRLSRKRNAGGTLSTGLAERLFKLQRGKCACGCKQPLGDDYQMDHRMPVALNGPNTDDNIQLLRAKCNRQKCAKHPIDFMQERGFLL